MLCDWCVIIAVSHVIREAGHVEATEMYPLDCISHLQDGTSHLLPSIPSIPLRSHNRL